MTLARKLTLVLTALVWPDFADFAMAQGKEVLTPLPATAAAGNTFSDWVFQTSGEGDQKVCFAATVAKQLGAGAAKRSESVLYISAWPKEGIRSEFSIKLGYPAKAIVGAKVTVGLNKYNLFIKGERAYVSDATLELKLLEAMKKGSKLTVEATAEGGGQVTDTYSLSGISQALQAQAAACP
ncbi:MAG: invasion associated locus B family protein [Hyphomicrobium sp.]